MKPLVRAALLSSVVVPMVAASVSFAGAATNTIVLRVDPVEAKTYKLSLGLISKFNFTEPAVSVNGSEPIAAEVGVRGKSCSKAPRRCFGVKLEKQIALNGSSKMKDKRFNLVSMWLDEGYISSKIGYTATEAIGLPTVKTEYTEVRIDSRGDGGDTNGLYLITEEPEDAIRDRYDSDAVIRRRSNDGEMEHVKKSAPFSEAQYLAAFDEIYAVAKSGSLSGEAFYKFLASRMNIDGYMRWLAFNSLFLNGDYADEIFFFAVPGKKSIYFDTLGWDYDDLFKKMHSGWKTPLSQKEAIMGTILYNYEDDLDVAIAKDPVLYAKFTAIAKELYKTSFSDASIDKIVDKVVSDIRPYLSNGELLAQSRKDGMKGFLSIKEVYTKEFILNLAESRKATLKARRAALLSALGAK